MKIHLDNVNVNSDSGPNSFGHKLCRQLIKMGHEVELIANDADVQLSFIQMSSLSCKHAPTALRLDGIYFNTRQDWHAMNRMIKYSYDCSELAIFQSNFNKLLVEKYFGEANSSFIINNGVDFDSIRRVDKLFDTRLDEFSEVWCCASSWRPHKRLKDNVRYFFEFAPKDACLVVLGNNPDYVINHKRVIYMGQMPWETCIAVYKRSTTFLHLAFLDHCPNVVVDARASGCQIVVSSSGGTKEIAGIGSLIVKDIDWDFSPIDLYSPPKLDFNTVERNSIESVIDISVIAERYVQALGTII